MNFIFKKSIDCLFRSTVVSFILHADDFLLSAPSIDSLQRLIYTFECVLGSLDLEINVDKSPFSRIGPPCNVPCCDISTITGTSLQWFDTVRRLGLYILLSRAFKCGID